jgi:hypothetical protein
LLQCRERTRPIGLGADDERSYQEDRKPRGGVPVGHGGGAEEALPGGAPLATTERCEVAEVRPLGSTKRHQSGSTALLPRAGSKISGPSSCPYSPECVEGGFCELRL